MRSPLESLIAAGTKLWLDSIDPQLVKANRALGATGATSNPVIVANLIKTGRFDDRIAALLGEGQSDDAIAWRLTDELVRAAQEVFAPVWRQTSGDDGYVSFEVDPLLEDVAANMPHEERVSQYLALAEKWSAGHANRMIKVPATPAGLASLETLAAQGLALNVTLIFSERQYQAARDAVWKGAQQRGDLSQFKSVYSIFVSRVDVYAEQHAADLSAQAQGWVGILNAKRIWADNRAFWSDKNTPLKQEIVFASTGVKKAGDDPAKYVAAFAGDGIETNPPATNDAVEKSGRVFQREIDQLPADEIVQEIDAKVDFQHLETTLMAEGLEKFASPQKALLALIAEKRLVAGKRSSP